MKAIFYLFLILAPTYTLAVEYKYDNANRISEATYQDGTVVSYTYDQNGNLLSMIPTESPSAGDSGTGGNETGGETPITPTTPQPAKQESSGGALGWLVLLFACGVFFLRARKNLNVSG